MPGSSDAGERGLESSIVTASGNVHPSGKNTLLALDVIGFDADAPNAIAAFARGEL